MNVCMWLRHHCMCMWLSKTSLYACQIHDFGILDEIYNFRIHEQLRFFFLICG
jgi:hypothetical protein